MTRRDKKTTALTVMTLRVTVDYNVDGAGGGHDGRGRGGGGGEAVLLMLTRLFWYPEGEIIAFRQVRDECYSELPPFSAFDLALSTISESRGMSVSYRRTCIATGTPRSSHANSGIRARRNMFAAVLWRYTYGTYIYGECLLLPSSPEHAPVESYAGMYVCPYVLIDRHTYDLF